MDTTTRAHLSGLRKLGDLFLRLFPAASLHCCRLEGEREKSMVTKIGINGFGRIGRLVFRAALNHPRGRGRRH